ncbi:hypothetical protein DAETH_22850 [Deinococcus aetherius]|uniref:Uncharacterized protein n=1 Tax=Deinococcus aetherius TaxID=200252 RepID=A0ABM8AEX2_9DEIO|nr:hypothetical protein [Deinococcus aetherius]BDP42316.1 hypothetical protein DAETH_22850 [Deinococcus aetherius]
MLGKSLLPLALSLLLLTPARALGLDRSARQGIDAHAFSFSGRHCAGGIEARPGSGATPGQFKIAALIMDEAMKDAAAKDKTVGYRSSFNDKDLYRAAVTTPKGSTFVMLYLSGGKTFMYRCDLK